jgi:hypothetical protein
MFAFFVSRRYGVAVPVVLFLVVWLIELLVDHKLGSGYFSSHFWSIGLSLFLSGVILTVMAVLIDDEHVYTKNNNNNNHGGYSSLLVEGDMETGRYCLHNFVKEPSQTDMFCYVPFNYCALALLGGGVLIMFLQLLPIS